jgi:hypothetical protein
VVSYARLAQNRDMCHFPTSAFVCALVGIDWELTNPGMRWSYPDMLGKVDSSVQVAKNLEMSHTPARVCLLAINLLWKRRHRPVL